MQYNDFLYDIDIELKREQFFYCLIQSFIMAFDLYVISLNDLQEVKYGYS